MKPPAFEFQYELFAESAQPTVFSITPNKIDWYNASIGIPHALNGVYWHWRRFLDRREAAQRHRWLVRWIEYRTFQKAFEKLRCAGKIFENDLLEELLVVSPWLVAVDIRKSIANEHRTNVRVLKLD